MKDIPVNLFLLGYILEGNSGFVYSPREQVKYAQRHFGTKDLICTDRHFCTKVKNNKQIKNKKIKR